MAKIIVTGGAGFIASHIVDAFITHGHRVVVIDNLITGKKINLNRRAKFYHADIRNAKKMNDIFAKERPTVVNHHAAIAEVVKSLINPLPTMETNVLGTINLLTAGQKHGMKQFIFASTGGAIYGDINKLPADENAPETPLSPYGLSKLIGEQTIKNYSRTGGFDYLIFRYPNVYGSRQNPHGEAGVIAIFSELIRNGKQPTIFGDGSKGRDYMHVADIVDANIRALDVARGTSHLLNLGWGKLITDNEVFETIRDALKSRVKCQYAPLRPGEVYRISLKAVRAKKVLGWQPTLTFKKGVATYVALLK